VARPVLALLQLRAAAALPLLAAAAPMYVRSLTTIGCEMEKF